VILNRARACRYVAKDEEELSTGVITTTAMEKKDFLGQWIAFELLQYS
jgi:hypothetical protein